MLPNSCSVTILATTVAGECTRRCEPGLGQAWWANHLAWNLKTDHWHHDAIPQKKRELNRVMNIECFAIVQWMLHKLTTGMAHPKIFFETWLCMHAYIIYNMKQINIGLDIGNACTNYTPTWDNLYINNISCSIIYIFIYIIYVPINLFELCVLRWKLAKMIAGWGPIEDLALAS